MTLRSSYEQIMDQVTLTEEAKARILTNLQHQPPRSNVTRFPKPTRWLTLAACLVVLVLGAVTLPNVLHRPAEEPPVQIGNPVEAYDSLEALRQATDLPVEHLDHLPFAVEETTYAAYDGQTAEVTYTGQTQAVTYRLSAGSEDNSGDWNTYDTTTQRQAAGTTVTLKGDGDGCRLATWQRGGYSYSLGFAQSVDEATVLALVEETQ